MNKHYILSIFLATLIFAFFAGNVFAYQYYSNCTYHAYRLCMGNNIYWFDSCGSQQELFQSCYGQNIICKYGQCVYEQPVNLYVAHKNVACYLNDLYWYDSLGKVSDLYGSCKDKNLCTADICSSAKCTNELKCDGSTCILGSEDYNKYCASNNNQNQKTLAVSFFVKQDPNSAQWQKDVEIGSDAKIYFMITIANNSSAEIGNVNISANIPNEISMLGNLQINGALLSGDIISGINIGSIQPGNTKAVSFEGKASSLSEKITKQATTSVSVLGNTQTDNISINLNPEQNLKASVSSSPAASGIIPFLKKWYIWILVGLVLVFLFVVVFRRLSNDN